MLFRVFSPARPVLGWVDTTTLEAFASLPICTHFRTGPGEPWLPWRGPDRPEGMSFRRRVRTDLDPELFAGEVVEASSVEEARREFARLYWLALDQVEGESASDAQTGLYGPLGSDSLLSRRLAE